MDNAVNYEYKVVKMMQDGTQEEYTAVSVSDAIALQQRLLKVEGVERVVVRRVVAK